MSAAQEKRGEKVVPLRRARPCPICGQKSAQRWHPFCSKRCADIDLHRWLSGAYAIPASDDESETPPEDGAPG